EIVFETSTTNLHQCLWSNSNSSASRSYIDTSGRIVTAYSGSFNTYTPSVDLRDGQQHTLRYEVDASADTITYDIDDGASVGTKTFTFTDTTIDTFGRRGDNNSLHFNGTIFSVEEGGASASTLTWNFDSGPPNYEVGEDQAYGYVHWYEPSNVTINTTTGDVEFSGLQNNFSSVLVRHESGTDWIADAGRNVVTFEVVAESGTVQVKVGGDGSGYKTTGVYTEILVANGATATVIQSNGGASLFKGSVTNLSIEPYIATISDGLVYEESEEQPLGADIGSEVTVPATGNVDMPGMISGAAYYIEPAVSASLTITTADGAGIDFANGLAFINAASTNLNIANSSGSPITFTPVVKPADNVAIYLHVLNPDWTQL
ncbi:MAG: hypothetical protein GY750_04915, partial [Lentisphaerae bacterium]|nr:hypothetical protein [Lentisphaerota bacterium]